MKNRTVEEATYELRKITEQLDDNRRAFTEHYRKKEDVATIFQEVTDSFHEDKEIWKEGENQDSEQMVPSLSGDSEEA
ncbi:hypothetical protein ACWOFR_05845 [Carnobacterium gallinarum]|uniref:hypothetical protein n=1 Tax=Carnobacterium gallinarum TaxID=2749 RepID=UPI00068B53C8|nr:hypothetical protein [Carnobacterium gallinarum]